jgi:hypothetical protein
MKYYEFRQNNSGGWFDVDDRVTLSVWIQATSANSANILADSLGIYFDGCKNGIDCDCCGDRWYPVTEDGAKDLPNRFSASGSMFIEDGKAHTRIYHIDGVEDVGGKPTNGFIRNTRIA